MKIYSDNHYPSALVSYAVSNIVQLLQFRPAVAAASQAPPHHPLPDDLALLFHHILNLQTNFQRN